MKFLLQFGFVNFLEFGVFRPQDPICYGPGVSLIAAFSIACSQRPDRHNDISVAFNVETVVLRYYLLAFGAASGFETF